MKGSIRWLAMVAVTLAAGAGVYMLVKDDPPQALARYATSPAKLFAAVVAMVGIVVFVPASLVFSFRDQKRRDAHMRATFLHATAQILERQAMHRNPTPRGRYKLRLLIEPPSGERFERDFIVNIRTDEGISSIDVGKVIPVRLHPSDRMRMFIEP